MRRRPLPSDALSVALSFVASRVWYSTPASPSSSAKVVSTAAQGGLDETAVSGSGSGDEKRPPRRSFSHHKSAGKKHHSTRPRAATPRRAEPFMEMNLGNGIHASLPGDAAAARISRGGNKKRKKVSSQGQTPSTRVATSSTSLHSHEVVAASTVSVLAKEEGGDGNSIISSSSMPSLAVVETVQRDIAQATSLSSSSSIDVDKIPAALHVLLSATRAASLSDDKGEGEGVVRSGSAEQQQQLRVYTSAQTSVRDLLSRIEEASHVTGRRYEPAFPAPLVCSLWKYAMPGLHHLYQQSAARVHAKHHQQQQQQQHHASQGVESLSAVTPYGGTGAVDLKLHRNFAAAYRALRRDLALRSRALSDLCSPDELVLMLARMQHCGALSDDVLGPIVTQLVNRLAADEKALTGHVARNHSLLAHMVSAAPEDVSRLPFQGSSAITLARVLGRQQAPRHFQFHKLMHTVLLPVLQRDLGKSAAALVEHASSQNHAEENGRGIEDMPPVSSLVDLTRCFVTYAVSGSAAESLTTLWQPHLATMSINDCSMLVAMLSQPPAFAKGSRRHHHSSSSSSKELNELVRHHRSLQQHSAVEDEYVALTDAVLHRVALICQSALSVQTTAADGGGGVGGEEVSLPSILDLLQWMEALLRVNSASWAETYYITTSALYAALQQQQGGDGGDHASLAALLPIGPTQAVVKALLHRNSMIPGHPVHRLLLQRLLHSSEAQNHVDVAGMALIGLELISLDNQLALDESGTTTTTTTTDSENAIATTLVSDENMAVGLLHAHRQSLSPTAFVAAMCVSPLQNMPPAEQQELVNHFTSVASALSPSWLVKGIVAAVSKMSPDVIDPVSVQRWFGRFTASDVARRVHLHDCSWLLHVMALKPEYGVNNALAKRAIVHRVGVLLRSETESAAALEVLPQLVPALHASNVFFAYLYSRVCRVVLAQVKSGPWEVVLPAFTVTAEEFMRRPRNEANATVFRDVWELLRHRIMSEAASTLSMDDVLAAWNGFSCLDGGDRPLFFTLLHRLWQTIMEGSAAAEGEGDGVAVVDADEMERRARLQADMGRRALLTMTPTSVAVLTNTLLRKGDGADVDMLLPWALVALQKCCRDLYPIDAVQTMPNLLEAFAALSDTEVLSSAQDNNNNLLQWGSTSLHASILHRAYDACRSHFLYMYAEVSEEGNGDGDGDSNDAVTVDAKDVLAERAEWSPKAAASVHLVPKKYFADILIQLSGSGVQDEAVAVACAIKVCTPRVCREQLSITHLVDVCLALCYQFSTPASPPASITASPVSDNAGEIRHSDDHADVVEAPLAPSKRFMPCVLDALWRRTDELQEPHINAVLRCLDFYYGEKVDRDFVQRLNAQRDILHQRAADAVKVASAGLAAVAEQQEEQHEEQPAAEEAAAVSLAEDKTVQEAQAEVEKVESEWESTPELQAMMMEALME